MRKAHKAMKTEAGPTDLLARLNKAAGAEFSKEAAAEIGRLRTENERLASVVREFDRLSLVIESAVRWQDPVNYEAVLALLRQNRAALAEETGADLKNVECDPRARLRWEHGRDQNGNPVAMAEGQGNVRYRAAWDKDTSWSWERLASEGSPAHIKRSDYPTWLSVEKAILEDLESLVNAEEDPETDMDTLESLREEVTLPMSETAPSWGYRLHRVLSIVGVNFGSPEELEWGFLREAHRQIRWDEEALQAANEDRDWPPFRWKEKTPSEQ